jgi:uncharacterized membrane protein YdbT with pleckstrin-like domain
LYTVAACLNIFWGQVMAAIVIAGAIFIQIKTGLPLGAPFKWGDNWLLVIMKLHPGIKLLALLLFIFGLMKFAQMMITQFATEIAVTSSRIIYKRGLVARYVGEMNIERIEGVSVYQSFLGRIFDFGNVIIRGLGVGEVILPPIRNPIKFRRAIEYARTIGEKS